LRPRSGRPRRLSPDSATPPHRVLVDAGCRGWWWRKYTARRPVRGGVSRGRPGWHRGRGPQTRDGRGGPAARHSTLSHLPRHRPAPSAHATMISTTRSRHTRSPAHHSHDTRGTYTPDRSGTVTGPRML